MRKATVHQLTIVFSHFISADYKSFALVAKQWNATVGCLLLNEYKLATTENRGLLVKYPVNAINLALALIHLKDCTAWFREIRSVLVKHPHHAEDYADALLHLYQFNHLNYDSCAVLAGSEHGKLWYTVYQLHKRYAQQTEHFISRFTNTSWDFQESYYSSIDMSNYSQYFYKKRLYVRKPLSQSSYLSVPEPEILINTQQSTQYDFKYTSLRIEKFIDIRQKQILKFNDSMSINYHEIFLTLVDLYQNRKFPTRYEYSQFAWCCGSFRDFLKQLLKEMHTYKIEHTFETGTYSTYHRRTDKFESIESKILNDQILDECEIQLIKENLIAILPYTEIIRIDDMSGLDFKRERDGIPYGLLELYIAVRFIENWAEKIIEQELAILTNVIFPDEHDAVLEATSKLLKILANIQNYFLSYVFDLKNSLAQYNSIMIQEAEKNLDNYLQKYTKKINDVNTFNSEKKLAQSILASQKKIVSDLLLEAKKLLQSKNNNIDNILANSCKICIIKLKNSNIKLNENTNVDAGYLNEDSSTRVIRFLKSCQEISFRIYNEKLITSKALLFEFLFKSYKLFLQNGKEIEYLKSINDWLTKARRNFPYPINTHPFPHHNNSYEKLYLKICDYVSGGPLREIGEILGFPVYVNLEVKHLEEKIVNHTDDSSFTDYEIKLKEMQKYKTDPERLNAINKILVQHVNDYRIRTLLRFLKKDPGQKINHLQELTNLKASQQVYHWMYEKSLRGRLVIEAQESYPHDEEAKQLRTHYTHVSTRRKSFKNYPKMSFKDVDLVTDFKSWDFKPEKILETEANYFSRLWKGVHIRCMYNGYAQNQGEYFIYADRSNKFRALAVHCKAIYINLGLQFSFSFQYNPDESKWESMLTKAKKNFGKFIENETLALNQLMEQPFLSEEELNTIILDDKDVLKENELVLTTDIDNPPIEFKSIINSQPLAILTTIFPDSKSSPILSPQNTSFVTLSTILPQSNETSILDEGKLESKESSSVNFPSLEGKGEEKRILERITDTQPVVPERGVTATILSSATSPDPVLTVRVENRDAFETPSRNDLVSTSLSDRKAADVIIFEQKLTPLLPVISQSQLPMPDDQKHSLNGGHIPLSISEPSVSSFWSVPTISTIMSPSTITIDFAIHAADLKLEDPPIGRGACGIVYKGEWRLNPVAVKKLSGVQLDAKAIKNLQNEANVMAQVSSRSNYLVKLMGICLESQNYSLVMEYMPNGNLYQYIHSDADIPWERRYRLATDITIGLVNLHEVNVLHCDLKSFNILLDAQFNAKLCDFGFSAIKTESSSSRSGIKGTPQWMAPELLNPEAKDHKPTKAADIYGLGMVLWELLTREIPYGRVNPMTILALILSGRRAWQKIPTGSPTLFARIIRECCAEDSAQRPQASIVQGRLYSLWQEENRHRLSSLASISASSSSIISSSGSSAQSFSSASLRVDSIVPSGTYLSAAQSRVCELRPL